MTLAYLALPYAWYITIRHWYKHKYDVNCIKKHPKYLTGKLKGKICKPISLRLAKLEAKKMNMTFNDLVMGIVSKSFKQYFVAKGDSSKFITLQIPYSMAHIPERIEEFEADNSFASMVCYLDLEEDFKIAC